jgi:hypothetical protein
MHTSYKPRPGTQTDRWIQRSTLLLAETGATGAQEKLVVRNYARVGKSNFGGSSTKNRPSQEIMTGARSDAFSGTCTRKEMEQNDRGERQAKSGRALTVGMPTDNERANESAHLTDEAKRIVTAGSGRSRLIDAQDGNEVRAVKTMRNQIKR